MRNSEKIPKMSMLFSYGHKEKPKKSCDIYLSCVTFQTGVSDIVFLIIYTSLAHSTNSLKYHLKKGFWWPGVNFQENFASRRKTK